MDRLAVIGNISRDHTRYPDRRGGELLGGAALHVALAAARAGATAAPVSVVGDDLAHIPAQSQLNDVDWSGLRIAAGASAAFTIDYDQEGHLIAVAADYGVSEDLTGHALAHIARHPRDRYHVCCRRPLNVPAVLEALTRCGARFSIDFFLPSAAHLIQAAAPWLAEADLVLTNAAEYRLLEQVVQSTAASEMAQGTSVGQVTRTLRGVVVTDGPRPVRWLLHGRLLAACTPPYAHPEEVTGAGDTLAGHLLARTLHGDSPAAALRSAVLAATRHTAAPRPARS
ncbi:PfkB family carbohydrate kinase [Streptomyces sp. NPDC015032]|uniref:PfkB family carbohydrate kinase n=1 Tax=Streptomyces sp. NPDC015032 TaxID=3364937 RepID=UPI0036F6825D